VLRVALVTPGYPPTVGGVEQHVYRLAMSLHRRGVDVEVWSHDRPGATPRSATEFPVRRFPTVGPKPYVVSPALVRALRRSVHRFDIVHGHNYHTSAVAEAALAGPSRLIVTPHFHGGGHTAIARVLHRAYRPLARTLLRGASGIVCVSRAESKLVVSEFPELRGRTTVIPNGVDVEAIRAAEPYPRSRVVLAIGRLESYKRLDVVVEALAHLPPEYTLVIIGKGPQEGYLRRIAQRSGIESRIEMLGNVPDSEVQRWLRTADVSVTLSQREAFGLFVAESLAAGTPLVASNIAAHREVLESAGAGAWGRLVEDYRGVTVAHAILAAGRLERRPFRIGTWDDVAEATLAMYEDALEPAGRDPA